MAESAEQVNEAMRRSTKEWRDAWPLDPHQDPYEVPLDYLDPAHPALFKANTVLPWFERLRAEAPVHKCKDSQFGPYWSLTRYDDVKYVDTHHDQFSSDIMNGGIRLGGRKLEAPPDPMFHLPMFIMADPPVHEAQRMAVAPMFAPSKLGRLGDLIRTRARPFIYSTGLPPGVVAASIAALDLIETDRELVAAPLRKAALFCARLNLPAPESCIVPILLGAPERALAASRLLEDEGFLVTAIRPPTVPEGTARLRLTFSAGHDDADIERLAAIVAVRILDRGERQAP